MRGSTLAYPLAAAAISIWLDAATAKSDCQCIQGFDPDAMPKMNVTNFWASTYSNGTSIYSFDVDFWPGQPQASCGASAQALPGHFAPVWGDAYCWNKADGSFVPLYWYWNQSWPDTNYTLRVDSKYLVTAHFCWECVETGTHIVSGADIQTVGLELAYKGRQSFALRPTTTHG